MNRIVTCADCSCAPPIAAPLGQLAKPQKHARRKAEKNRLHITRLHIINNNDRKKREARRNIIICIAPSPFWIGKNWAKNPGWFTSSAGAAVQKEKKKKKRWSHIHLCKFPMHKISMIEKRKNVRKEANDWQSHFQWKRCVTDRLQFIRSARPLTAALPHVVVFFSFFFL